MHYFIQQIEMLNSKIDLLLNQPESIMGDLISALIGAVALIISVIIGTQSIKKKIAENRLNDKIATIENCNIQFNQEIQELLLNTSNKNNPIQHYKEVELFYLKNLRPLCSKYANASVDVTTGLYILERYTKFLLKLRLPNRYSNTNMKKDAFVDSNYFSHIYNFLNLISFFSRESVSLPEKVIIKKNNLDYVQSKIGGPKDNFKRINVITNINGIKYDPRYFLYYDFYKLIVDGNHIDTYKAYANFLQEKIVFPVSKYLFENKFYAPLYIKCNCAHDNYPPFFLMGFKKTYPLGCPSNITLTLYYVNLQNWMYFETAVIPQLKAQKDITFYNQKIDMDFMKLTYFKEVNSIAHVISYEVNFDASKKYYNKNKRKIEKFIKKLHRG